MKKLFKKLFKKKRIRIPLYHTSFQCYNGTNNLLLLPIKGYKELCYLVVDTGCSHSLAYQNLLENFETLFARSAKTDMADAANNITQLNEEVDIVLPIEGYYYTVDFSIFPQKHMCQSDDFPKYLGLLGENFFIKYHAVIDQTRYRKPMLIIDVPK